jgi:hypothetical protein
MAAEYAQNTVITYNITSLVSLAACFYVNSFLFLHPVSKHALCEVQGHIPNDPQARNVMFNNSEQMAEAICGVRILLLAMSVLLSEFLF